MFGRFALIGAIGYGINLLVYTGLIHSEVIYLVAACFAFLLANLTNYTLNRKFTFDLPVKAPLKLWVKSWLQFLSIGLIALVFNLAILATLVELFKVGAITAQALAIILATPMNYVGNRLWTFRS